MTDTQIALNPNKIVQYLKKPAREFTKQDLIKFIEDNNIGSVNFRYVGGDGRLKTGLTVRVCSHTSTPPQVTCMLSPAIRPPM